MAVDGENILSVALVAGDAQAEGPIVIDEVEVWVNPR